MGIAGSTATAIRDVPYDAGWVGRCDHGSHLHAASHRWLTDRNVMPPDQSRARASVSRNRVAMTASSLRVTDGADSSTPLNSR